jgi:hypothetical protein
MDFAKYIDNRFQEVKVLEEAMTGKNPEAFPIAYDAEQKALHAVLTWYRGLLKWCLVPKVFFGYALVCLGLREKPTAPLIERMKALKAKQDAEKAAGNVAPIVPVAGTNVEGQGTPPTAS